MEFFEAAGEWVLAGAGGGDEPPGFRADGGEHVCPFIHGAPLALRLLHAITSDVLHNMYLARFGRFRYNTPGQLDCNGILNRIRITQPPMDHCERLHVR